MSTEGCHSLTQTGHPAVLTDGGVAASRQPLARPATILAGIAGAAGLLAFYFAVMGLAEGLDAALELLQADWYLVAPLVAGFGVQVTLFAHLVSTRRKGSGVRAVTGANTGVSGVSMLACCAHHLVDVLPFLGLAGVALFLGQYRVWFMAFGIASNLAGIAFMARMVRRMREAEVSA